MRLPRIVAAPDDRLELGIAHLEQPVYAGVVSLVLRYVKLWQSRQA